MDNIPKSIIMLIYHRHKFLGITTPILLNGIGPVQRNHFTCLLFVPVTDASFSSFRIEIFRSLH
jgi:hypothetical protein